MFSIQSNATKLGSILALALCLLVAPSGGAHADEDRVIIDIESESKAHYPIAVPVGVGGDDALAAEVAKVATFDFRVAGFFKVIDPRSYLADLNKEGMSIDPQKWKAVGAFGVTKTKAETTSSGIKIEFRLFEVSKGKQSVLTRSYQGSKSDLRDFTHAWCNEVVKYYTGEAGFFGSKIAFVTRQKKAGKKVMAMDFDGTSVYSLTRNRYINILPAWSPGGGQVAFTSYMRDNPDLYVVGAGGGRPKRVSRQRGMNTGASWSPDGSKLAITLSKDGNPEIYVIAAKSGRIIKRLTNNRHIDTSPTWSPDGKELAFVSDREGSPQIFVMNANGSNQRRVSLNGSYNTTPEWSPRSGQRVVAYTTRDGGNFDIVTLDLNSNKYTRITQGEGNNEEPSFSPNGRAIAFASRRSAGAGIYIANADGTGNAVRVWKGTATSVDWGPAPKAK